MKILILVLSFTDEPYLSLMRSQQRSWDSIEAEGVRTVYYHGGSKDGHCWYEPETRELQLPCGDKYFYMTEKMKLALDYIEFVKEFDYDIIFRSNSSSYLHKQRLKNFAQTLPTEKLYAGWTFIDSEDFGGICVSGAGIFLSRDTAEILRNEIDPNKELEEDVYCGRILRKHGIEAIDDKSRFDVGEEVDAYPPTDRYHYRLKNGDRLQDASNMKILHEKIK